MTNGRVAEGIRIEFIGDSGPFSRTGKSIGYRITIKDSAYLLDLGGPVFQHVGTDGIRAMKGVFATHSHEDHRRWFTDLALFMFYTGIAPLRLIATEVIHEEWEKNAKAALERSLSPDQKRVVEVPYDSFVEKIYFGPRAKYQIAPVQVPSYPEGFVWRVLNEHGEAVDPALAKVVVHPRANRPRMLFMDPFIGEWVEPETFYSLSDTRFYQEEQNPFRDEEAGLTVRPVKSVAWHGPPTYGMEFLTARERVLFTSDTVYDPELWHALAHEHREQKNPFTKRDFETRYLITDDINNYIERTWSVERLREAMSMYEGGIVIHDVDHNDSVVHTRYAVLKRGEFKNLLLTHSPDDFVSEMPLARERKSFRVIGDWLYEEVGDKLYPYHADIYVKRYSWFFVGFKNKEGKVPMSRTDKRLHIALPGDEVEGEIIERYDLYADIDGRYYPVLEDPSLRYQRRPDGGMDRVSYTPDGSVGVAVANLRDRLVPPIPRPECDE